MSYTTDPNADPNAPPFDPNNPPPSDPGNLFDIDHQATDDAIEQQLNDAAAASPPDSSADGSQRHPLGPDGFINNEPINWANGDPGARTAPMPEGPGPTGIPGRNDGVYKGEAFNWANGDPGAGLPGSPTAGIYNDIYKAQGGNPPSGPNGTVSPTDPIYQDIVNAQGGQFPQGPSTPEAAAVSGLPAGGGPRASIAAAPADPNAHFITRLGVDSTPALPAGGSPLGSPTSAANAGAPGSFQQEFQKQFGFYNPEFNSQANMEQNLLKGDSVIRPQAEYMAQFDPNLKAELATINGLPDFYNSQNAANWDAAHNPQLAASVANGETSLAAAKGQGVNVPVHPVDNAHALATQGMQDSLLSALTGMGVDPNSIHQSFDPYGNATLNFTSASGKPQTVQATLVGYANAIEQLKQNVAATAQPPAGGGLPQRPAASRYAPPRGGGGFAPPGNAPQPPAAPPNMGGETGTTPGTNAFGFQSQTGGAGLPSLFDAQPFNNAGKTGYGQQVRPFDVPGGVNY